MFILGIWKHRQEFAFWVFFCKEKDLWMCEVFHVWCIPVLLWSGGQTGRCLDVSSLFFKRGNRSFSQQFCRPSRWRCHDSHFLMQFFFKCLCINGWNAETLEPNTPAEFLFMLKSRSHRDTDAEIVYFNLYNRDLWSELGFSSSFQIQNCLFSLLDQRFQPRFYISND